MEKFTKTTLFKLKQGDRFYYLADKTKRKYEVISTPSKSRFIRGDNEFRDREIKKDRRVVFLRNSNNEN